MRQAAESNARRALRPFGYYHPSIRSTLDEQADLEKEGFEAADLDAGLTVFGPKDKGCKSCNGGYKGRVGIFQVMEVSETMGRLIMEGGNAMQIADQAASEGVFDLRRAGLNKVKDGVTSLVEINRVTIE